MSLKIDKNYDPFPELLDTKDCYGSNPAGLPKQSSGIGSVVNMDVSKENFCCGSDMFQIQDVRGYGNAGLTNPVGRSATLSVTRLQPGQSYRPGQPMNSLKPFQSVSKENFNGCCSKKRNYTGMEKTWNVQDIYTL